MPKTTAVLRIVSLSLCPVFSLLAQQDADFGPAPIPEPATIALLGLGLAGIGFASWRKNKKK